jgi:hypothetical protein
VHESTSCGGRRAGRSAGAPYDLRHGAPLVGSFAIVRTESGKEALRSVSAGDISRFQLRQDDPELRIGPGWGCLVAALERVGVDASAAQLEVLALLVP